MSIDENAPWRIRQKILNESIVVKTPCYPKEWKVEERGFPGRNNGIDNFFYTYAEARIEADKRNERYRMSIEEEGKRRSLNA
jgi:hypothetical protein